MSVLKEKRTTSKAEYVNTANQIYVKTVDFLSRLSARYSRLIAADTARLAGQVMDHAEQANKIFPSDAQRKELRKAHHLEAMIRRAEEKGLTINRNKCHVISLDKPFRFCKAKFQILPSGRIITHGCRDGMKRARRKMRYFRQQVDAGEKTVEQVAEWLKGPIAYYEQFNDHGRVLKLRRLYYALFIKDRKTEEEIACIGL